MDFTDQNSNAIALYLSRMQKRRPLLLRCLQINPARHCECLWWGLIAPPASTSSIWTDTKTESCAVANTKLMLINKTGLQVRKSEFPFFSFFDVFRCMSKWIVSSQTCQGWYLSPQTEPDADAISVTLVTNMKWDCKSRWDRSWQILFWCYCLNFHFVFVPIFHDIFDISHPKTNLDIMTCFHQIRHMKSCFWEGKVRLGFVPTFCMSQHLTMFFFCKTFSSLKQQLYPSPLTNLYMPPSLSMHQLQQKRGTVYRRWVLSLSRFLHCFSRSWLSHYLNLKVFPPYCHISCILCWVDGFCDILLSPGEKICNGTLYSSWSLSHIFACLIVELAVESSVRW
jgi:hypothetical protein